MRGRLLGKAASITAVLAVVALAACGSDDNTSDSSTPGTTGNSAAVSSPGGTDASTGEQRTIGVVDFEPASLAAHAAYTNTVDEFNSLGWEVLEGSADGDVDTANTVMTQFASQGADAIVVLVFPAEALGGGLAAAADADIPVFSLGGGLGDGIVANIDAVVADAAGEALLDAVGDGPADVLDLTYTPGKPCRDRSAFLNEQFAERPDVTLTSEEVALPGSLQSGQDIVTAYLQSHPAGGDPIYVTTCIGDGALGAVAAATIAGRDDVQIFSSDASSTLFQAVQNGEIKAMLWQDMPGAGAQMGQILTEYFKSGSVAENNVPLGTATVTQDNADDFLAEHPDDPLISG